MSGQAASKTTASKPTASKPTASKTMADTKPAVKKQAAKQKAAAKTPRKTTTKTPDTMAAVDVEAPPPDAPEPTAEGAAEAATEAAAPVQARSPARLWTARVRTAFLEALADLGQVRAAARAAGISSQRVYRERQKCPVFAADWDAAMDRALDALEETLLDRAMNGVEKPVYYGGKSCGSVRQYSDALAMFLLRARRPETYGRAASAEAQAMPGAAGGAEDPVALIEARLRALADKGGGGA